MTAPKISPEELYSMTPEQHFLFVTNYIYEARKDGRLDDIAAVLSAYDDENARKAILVGSSALLAMAPGPYREALKSSLAKTTYDHLRRTVKP